MKDNINIDLRNVGLRISPRFGVRCVETSRSSRSCSDTQTLQTDETGGINGSEMFPAGWQTDRPVRCATRGLLIVSMEGTPGENDGNLYITGNGAEIPKGYIHRNKHSMEID
jgi:hypothetical protein